MPTTQCTAAVPVPIAPKAALAWTYTPRTAVEPAAPIVAYGTLFSGGLDGVVRAISTDGGELKWSAYTGGPILFPPVAYGKRLYVGSGDGWVYCFDAASGQQCWRFRAAPVERKIPIYGKLCSTWPVGSGVLVDQGVVYPAAGVANYDGTHVYALDADDRADPLAEQHFRPPGGADSLAGVSVQGHLLLRDGKLYLAGGNAVSPAVYDARDGRCLSEFRGPAQVKPPGLQGQDVARGAELKYIETIRSCPHGQDLFLVQDRVWCFDRRLYGPNRYWPSRGFLGPLVLAHRGETVIRDLNGRVSPWSRNRPWKRSPKLFGSRATCNRPTPWPWASMR